MDQAQTEFLTALGLIETIVPDPIEYRLHYNDLGEIYLCTMQQHPENTQYVVVSKEEYRNYFRYTVVNNALKLVDISTGNRVQLIKSDSGYCVVKDHAGLLLEPNETYNEVEYYAYN